MDIEGKIIKKLAEQGGTSAKGAWVKQDIVIEQTKELNKKMCITLWGDKVKEAASLSIGDTVSIGVNIESREYNERWYTEVRAWKITPLNSQQSESLPPMGSISPEQYSSSEQDNNSGDDLPF